MKKLNFLLLLLPALLISSCAKDIYMSYPNASETANTIILKPNRTTEKTYVSIDSNVIVANKNVRSVVIRNIPNGTHNVHYTASNAWYQKKVDKNIPILVENGQQVKEHIKVPYNNWEYANIGGRIALTALVAVILK